MESVPECLGNISPRWYKVLQEYNMEDIFSYVFFDDMAIPNDDEAYLNEEIISNTLGLNIQEFDCCIVGEAWNHDSRYASPDLEGHPNSCPTCNRFSMNFYNFFEEQEHGIITTEEDDFVGDVKLFCEHIKEDHKELIKNECER